MKKTKIKFEDIQAGDLIQTVETVHGVKWDMMGIVFEKFGLSGEQEWRTSQGGVVVDEADEGSAEIYRIDPLEATFDDIRKGDLIRVTTQVGDTSVVIEGRAHRLMKRDDEESPYDQWISEGNCSLMSRKYNNSKVEILERAGE